MSTQSNAPGFALPADSALDDLIVAVAVARLGQWLEQARPGLCGRIDDLPAPLMAQVAARLHSKFGEGSAAQANIRLLKDGASEAPWECHWTQAVALRNEDESGRKRPPLLLLVPPGTQLLGSLDWDTFKAIRCDDLVREILRAELEHLPEALSPVAELLKRRETTRSTTDVQRARYLLALARNGNTQQAAGMALCLLGLWPHRDWLSREEDREFNLSRNREKVQRLREGTSSLLKRIYDLGLRSEQQGRRIYELISSAGSIDAAAERVAVDPGWQDLDFGNWEFASTPESVVVTLDPLPEMPRREDGYPVLRVREQRELPLSWSVQPAPSQAQGLTHYLVYLVPSSAEDGGAAYTSEAIDPGKQARKRFKLKDLAGLVQSDSLPEGLYRVQVTAWSNQTNITSPPAEGEDPANLSPYFWIEDTGDGEPLPDTSTRERLASNYLEARREMQWMFLKAGRDPQALPAHGCSWNTTAAGKAAQAICTIKFGRQTFRVRLSNLLRRFEATILAKPESLGALRADLTYGIAPREVQPSERSDIPKLAAEDPFLKARTDLFAKIRGEDGQGTVETADLLALRQEILAYAAEYGKLLQDAERDVAEDAKRWPERVGLAAIDTIRLSLPSLSEQTSVAILLAPTHPLRVLWLLQLGLLGEYWLRQLQDRAENAPPPEIREALQGGLQPLNIPPVLFDRRRVGYLQAGAIAPGWDIYLPAEITDKQAAIARLSRALACSPRTPGTIARARELGARIESYLQQHPYIDQLQINVFNPGDGTTVVELLSVLDARYPDLRYDVRLFSDENRDDVGVALDQLVNPEVTVGETAEKYSQSSRYPLHPSLVYSKNRITDFLAEPRAFQAHLSVLLDVFHPRVDVCAPFEEPAANNLYGLVQDETVHSSGAQGRFAWERQVVPGLGKELSEGSQEGRVLSEALAATQRFVAALGASPSVVSGRVPTLRLDLSVGGQNLLYEIHRASDWVLTIDRHLGLDYYDSAPDPESPSAPGILLDFTPEFPTGDNATLMLTTRVDEEIDRLVAPVLQRLDLEQPGCPRRVVEWLRSLSGRLAMRLLSAPIASQGVIGMALARAFLERMDLLEDTIVIPVDAHVRLLQKATPDDESKTRTDLILVRRVETRRQFEFALVEVKCSAGQLTTSSYQALREEMRGQLQQTQSALAALFDPSLQTPDRLERPVRNQLLGRWLQFYVGRARRYGTLTEEAEQGIRELILDLEAGYTLSFRQTGVVFELGREEDLEDPSGEFTVHRVGRLTCEQLLRGEPAHPETPPSWDRVRVTIRGGEVWDRTDRQPQTPSDGPDTPTSPCPALPETPALNEGAPREEGTSAEHHSVATQEADAATGQASIVVPSCSYLVGAGQMTPQWGLLGKLGADPLALDLNGCNTLSLFGVQGGGKSYTMGTILEMAVQPIPGITLLPHPLAAVVFHYNESQDYPPEFVTMAHPNQVPTEIERLRQEFGACPQALGDILVLTPEDKVPLRRQEFPGIAVEPIAFHPSELTIQDWRFLMGAVGNDSLYIRELNMVLRSIRNNVTLQRLREAIEHSHLSQVQQNLVQLRLRFVEQFVRDGASLRDKLYPGRLVIVDLRDELIETDEALGLFVVMLRVFAGATHQGQPFNKWIAFDEAHKYIRNPELVDSVVEAIRQMRHQGTSVLIASQDPPSLPVKIVELSSLVMLHRMDSPGWLKHIQKAVTPLADLTPTALARLRPGEAFLWARAATDPLFSHRAVKIQCRPRVTQHGGATRAASDP